ncbi:MAG: DUF881 domain-containing protein [Ruminococcaceae bacterium]|nr:DUF881 domain-containing protein [Oscillospiraceae bacterium]
METKKTNNNIGKQVALTLICVLLGFAISLQLRSVRINRSTATDNLRAQELQTQLNAEKEKNESLAADLEDAKNQLAEFRKNSENSGAISSIVSEQLINAEKLAGLTALTGPGVTVSLSDAKTPPTANPPENSIIHDSDIRTVLNELLASGAEALSINGERIISTSSIRCVGPTVIINNTRLSSPFVITAIGDAKTLEAGLIIKGGVVDALTPWGIDIDIATFDKVNIPAYTGVSTFKYAEVSDADKTVSEKNGGGN